MSKYTSFNINDSVKVKLTEHGRKVNKEDRKEFWISVGRPGMKYDAPTEDEDGWSKWQLWSLMRTFGHHLNAGSQIPFETEIKLEL